MSEKEKEIAETFKRVIPNLPEEKKEYLLGMAEGMSIMADRQRMENDAQTNQDVN